MEELTRAEKWLNAIAEGLIGVVDADLPQPITREEMYLQAIYEEIVFGGGGGGGGTGDGDMRQAVYDPTRQRRDIFAAIENVQIKDENSGKPIKFWFGTMEEYNALSSVDPNTFYNILESAE